VLAQYSFVCDSVALQIQNDPVRRPSPSLSRGEIFLAYNNRHLPTFADKKQCVIIGLGPKLPPTGGNPWISYMAPTSICRGGSDPCGDAAAVELLVLLGEDVEQPERDPVAIEGMRGAEAPGWGSGEGGAARLWDRKWRSDDIERERERERERENGQAILTVGLGVICHNPLGGIPFRKKAGFCVPLSPLSQVRTQFPSLIVARAAGLWVERDSRPNRSVIRRCDQNSLPPAEPIYYEKIKLELYFNTVAYIERADSKLGLSQGGKSDPSAS